MCAFTPKPFIQNWSWSLLPGDVGLPAWSVLLSSLTICAVPGDTGLLGRIQMNLLVQGCESWGQKTGAGGAVYLGWAILATWGRFRNLSSPRGDECGDWIGSGGEILFPIQYLNSTLISAVVFLGRALSQVGCVCCGAEGGSRLATQILSWWPPAEAWGCVCAVVRRREDCRAGRKAKVLTGQEGDGRKSSKCCSRESGEERMRIEMEKENGSSGI